MGGWAWQEVADHLVTQGHAAAPITYSSMDRGIGLDDHVADVVHAIDVVDGEESGERAPVVLVGHSYGGLVAGLAVDRARRRPDHTIYVDSPVPMGISMLDAMPADVGAAVADQVAATGFWMPPSSEVLVDDGVGAATAEAAVGICVPHPGKTLQTPANTSVPPSEKAATYIRCVSASGDYLSFAGVDEFKNSSKWDFLTIESGHWPMLSAPSALGALLVRRVEN